MFAFSPSYGKTKQNTSEKSTLTKCQEKQLMGPPAGQGGDWKAVTEPVSIEYPKLQGGPCLLANLLGQPLPKEAVLC